MPSVYEQLREQLPDCLTRDRHRLSRQLNALRRRPDDKKLDSLARQLEKSCAVVAARQALSPEVSYPRELPVAQKIESIKNLVGEHQVVVVAGETGSGKTTQLPKLCLAMGRGLHGRIGHTQPRRLAARSVASRLTEDLGSAGTPLVGCQVRFADSSTDATRIKLMTDGILLAEIRADPWLNQYDTLIIDEAHERSLNIDFLLGYLKRLLPRRPDLKVIITSATIDVQKFSAHFDDAPVIEVSGRTYPVEVEYRPAPDADADDLPGHILEVVQEIRQRDREQPLKYRDILVFLTGERDIRDVADTLRRSDLANTEILPLYARLSAGEQDRIFKPHPGRRIVLATNVAETSLTVPGIGYVIDAGTARISRYSVRSKVQRLPVEAISQASARQRAGRCGRLAPGVCFRLYAEEDFNARPEFTDTEIMRTHLGSVILQMLSLKLGDIDEFPFVDRPEDRAIRDGFRLLEELGAVDDRHQLTDSGRTLARIPVDPKLARILLEASRRGCLSELLIIVSALSIQDPRERPLDKQQAADEKHKRWQHPESDFMAFVALWQGFEEERQQLGSSQLRRYCQKQFLSWLRMREWRELHRQLLLVCRELGFTLNREPGDYAAIHQSLLTGLLGQVARRLDEGGYLASRNRKFQVFPGSVLHRKKTRWILAGELVETSQFYARTNARIEPEWVEALAGPLLKREYLEPHWSRKQGRVMAWERVSLYGLVVVERRRVPFGKIDPEASRELFIREALVGGDFNTRAAFFHHNRELVKAVEGLEEKTRRRDILVDESRLEAFYDQQLPQWVNDSASLERWLGKTRRSDPKALYFSREMLERDEASAPEQSHFPDRLSTTGLDLPLNYAFDPGSQHDGVSVTVPVSALRQLSESDLDWLVPGMLRDKCIALVKTLPKPLRKHFVPVPDSVDRILPVLKEGEGILVQQLARHLGRLAGVMIPAEAFGRDIDEHLRMNITVTGPDGRVLGSDRDLSALKSRFAGETDAALRSLDDEGFQRSGITTWDFGELPVMKSLQQGGHRIDAFPALVDEGDSVALQLLDSRSRAEQATWMGVTRLFMLATAQQQRYLKKELFRDPGERLALSLLGKFEWLQAQTLVLACSQTFDCRHYPRSREAFHERLAASKGELVNTCMRLGAAMVGAAEEYRLIRQKLSQLTSPAHLALQKAVKTHLAWLLPEDFPKSVPVDWLPELPRYLKAVNLRLERYNASPARDEASEKELQHWQEQYLVRKSQQDGSAQDDEALEALRWMLEEYRVSLFAQQLGTRVPVSAKRLERAFLAL